MNQAIMDDHIKKLSMAAQTVGRSGQAFYCLMCAERLSLCCWAFERVYQHGLQPYFLWTDVMFERITTRSEDGLDLQKLLSEVDASIPMSDTYGDELGVQAQSAMICLLSAAGALSEASPPGDGNVALEHLIQASNSVVDAIDNFASFAHSKVMVGEFDLINLGEYDLLKRERQRQFADVEFVLQFDQRTKRELLERRFVNLQYSIPISV